MQNNEQFILRSGRNLDIQSCTKTQDLAHLERNKKKVDLFYLCITINDYIFFSKETAKSVR